MNCTALRRASAHHFLFAEAIMGCVLSGVGVHVLSVAADTASRGGAGTRLTVRLPEPLTGRRLGRVAVHGLHLYSTGLQKAS